MTEQSTFYPAQPVRIDFRPVQQQLEYLECKFGLGIRAEIVDEAMRIYAEVLPILDRIMCHRGMAKIKAVGWIFGDKFTFLLELNKTAMIVIFVDVGPSDLPDPHGVGASGAFKVQYGARSRHLSIPVVARRTAAVAAPADNAPLPTQISHSPLIDEGTCHANGYLNLVLLRGSASGQVADMVGSGSKDFAASFSNAIKVPFELSIGLLGLRTAKHEDLVSSSIRMLAKSNRAIDEMIEIPARRIFFRGKKTPWLRRQIDRFLTLARKGSDGCAQATHSTSRIAITAQHKAICILPSSNKFELMDNVIDAKTIASMYSNANIFVLHVRVVNSVNNDACDSVVDSGDIDLLASLRFCAVTARYDMRLESLECAADKVTYRKFHVEIERW